MNGAALDHISCRSNHCWGNNVSFYTAENYSPDISVGYLAKQVYQITLKGLEPAFVGEDVSYLQWSALVSILYGRGLTCRALAHDLGHDKGATTRLIDTLEERGLVIRDRDAEDRRVINLRVTVQGEEIARRCMLRVLTLWNGWLADWSPDDATRLIGYLQRLRTSLETAVGDEPCA